MINNGLFTAVVRCFTFNHAAYIREAMDGFCMQETTFPFVCAIVDDASNDGEPEVIYQYLKENFVLDDKRGAQFAETDDYDMVFAQHKRNQNCYFSIILLKYNHHSIQKSKLPYLNTWNNVKYIAVCEGDDYWTYPLKLQMQVDYLEQHNDYVLCHTDYEATIKRHTHYKELYLDGNYIPGMFLTGFNIGNLTTVFRTEAYNSIPMHFQDKNWPMGDKPLWYELAGIGKIKYFPVVTAVYRILSESASHFKDAERQIAFKRSGLEITQFYAKNYGIELKDNGYTPSFYSALFSYAYKFDRKDLAEQIMKEAQTKKMVNTKGLCYYFLTKYRFLRSITNPLVLLLK